MKSFENKSHLLRERSGCSSTRVENWRRAELGQNLCSHRRQHHARSRCWDSAVYRGPAPEQGRCHPRNARARSTMPGSADRVPLGVSRLGGTKCSGGLRRDGATVPRTALPRSHGGQHDASNPQYEPIRNRVQESARHRSPRSFGSLNHSQTAYPGHDPRRPEQLLETRLSEAIETATSTSLSALDNDDDSTAVHPECRASSGRVLATDCRKPDRCIRESPQLRLPKEGQR